MSDKRLNININSDFYNEDKVTFEELSQSLQSRIDEPNNRLDILERKISQYATEINKVLSESEIDTKINNISAFAIYKDTNQHNFNTKAELVSATVFYNASGEVRIPTSNDYTYVLQDESHLGHLCRYVHNGTAWGFQIEVNFNVLEAGTGLNITNEIINHNNRVSAVTTESLRTIKYDTEGHITGSSEKKVDVSSSQSGSNNLITSGAVNNEVVTINQKLSTKLDVILGEE